MTLNEMRDAVYRRLGDASYLTGGASPSVASPEEVRRELNMAALSVGMDIFRQGVTLLTKYVDVTVTSGTQEYPLSAGATLSGETNLITDDDFLGLILVEDQVTLATPSTWINAHFVDGGDIRRKNAARSVSAPGEKLYLNGQRLGFVTVPTAADTYRITYAPKPAELTDLGDADSEKLILTIPTEYHQFVVQTAVVEIYAAEDSPSAERARTKWQQLRESLLATVGSRFRQQPIVRRGRRR